MNSREEKLQISLTSIWLMVVRGVRDDLSFKSFRSGLGFLGRRFGGSKSVDKGRDLLVLRELEGWWGPGD